MKSIILIVIVVAVWLLIMAAGVGGIVIARSAVNEIRGELARTQTGVDTSNIDLPQGFNGGVFLVIAVVVVCGYLGREIVKSGHGVTAVIVLVVFALIGGWLWLTAYRGGDVSTAEARDANLQTIKVVQPNGIDPERDAAYAEVNQGNSNANLTNAKASTLNGVALAAVLLALLLGGAFFVTLHRIG